MDYDEKDVEVIKLLSRLKQTEGVYPAAMLASRRRQFVQQMSVFGLGLGAALILKGFVKAAGGSSFSGIAGIVLEAALIVVIVAEAGYMAVANREKILDFFQSNATQATVEQAGTDDDSDLPPVEMPVTGPSLPAETAEPAAIAATPTFVNTPSATAEPATSTPVTADNGGEAQPNSTVEPHDNNGNHYGQTPRPQRTKDPGSNSQPTHNTRSPK